MSIGVSAIERSRALWSSERPSWLPERALPLLGEASLAAYVRQWAVTRPDDPAIWFYGRTVSWAELDAASDKLACCLLSRGLQRGARVGLFMANCPEYEIGFFGIMKAGLVVVPINPLLMAPEVAYELDDCGIEAVICAAQLQTVLAKARPLASFRVVLAFQYGATVPAKCDFALPESLKVPDAPLSPYVESLEALLDGPPMPPLEFANDPDEIAVLNYTGGTTGRPKGCIHTHGNIVQAAANGVTYSVAISEPAVIINFLPIFWIAGENWGILYPILSGSTHCLLARWDVETVARTIEVCKVSHFYGVVENVESLLDHAEAHESDLSSLRSVQVTSFVRKISVEGRRRVERTLGASYREASWGMTETHTWNCYTEGLDVDDRDLEQGSGFVGLPMPDTEFRIVDIDTREDLPLGAIGEIVVRSPTLMKGYWNKPEETARVLRDGWLYTGDLGRIGSWGAIHYVGRNKDMLKINGMSVYPSEIEACLVSHPSVSQVAVVGLPDSKKGELALALVVAKDGKAGDAEALNQWCADRMASYKVPRVEFVQELPLTNLGKIDKLRLRQCWTQKENRP